MPAAIHCCDLRKTYDGKVEAVRGLSLDIQSGEWGGISFVLALRWFRWT